MCTRIWLFAYGISEISGYTAFSECMICFVAVGWLIFLGFETEFQSISGRLIGDLCVISFACYFWAIYGVFELQRLVSDFADVLDAPFLLEEARMYCCVPVRRCETEMIYQTV